MCLVYAIAKVWCVLVYDMKFGDVFGIYKAWCVLVYDMNFGDVFGICYS